MINYGPKSVWLLVLGGPKSVGRNQDGPKSVATLYSTVKMACMEPKYLSRFHPIYICDA